MATASYTVSRTMEDGAWVERSDGVSCWWKLKDGMAVVLETRRWGSISDPSSDELRAAARSLREDDPEHPDCWLTDLESGWTLTADQSGVLKWSSEREGVQDVHLRGVPREKVLTLWRALARGDIATVAAEPWQPGSGW